MAPTAVERPKQKQKSKTTEIIMSSSASSSSSDDDSVMSVDKPTTSHSSSSSSSSSSKKRPSSATKQKTASTNTTTTTTPVMKKMKVSVTKNDPSYDPVVVSFPRGVPTSVIDNETNNNNSKNKNNAVSFTYSKLKASSSRGKKLVGSDNTTCCTYTASASGRGHDGRLTKLHIVIYDKKHNTWKVVPSAEKGTVFALDQVVEEYVPNVIGGGTGGSMGVGGGNATSNGNNNDNDKTMKASDRVQLLVESFGSKKKQKVMASRAANMVNINSVVGAGNAMMESVARQGDKISEGNREAMTTALDGDGKGASKLLNPVEAALMQARLAFLPPFDENAPTPQKVYNSQQIAESTAWDRCSRIVDKVLKKSQENNTNFVEDLLGKGQVPESIKTLMSSLSPTSKGNAYRIKTAFFLFLTMRFHGKILKKGFITGQSLDDCINACHVPYEVGSRLFDIFTTPMEGGKEDGYIASRQLKDKRQVYCLILYIIASASSSGKGGSMKVSSINKFCKDMQLDDKSAMALLREAGFIVKKSGLGDIGVSLSVPLKFPGPKRGKKS